MYFVLRCPPILNQNGELLVEIQNNDEVGDVWEWGSGDQFDEDEISSIPSPISMEVEYYRAYEGLPNELRDIGVSVMSKRLKEALNKAGVDNIDFYPVILTHPESGRTFEYAAYNLIGKVAATDLEQSEIVNYDNKLVADVGINKLVLDETKTNNLLMFRLAENLSTILIHESVKKAIENSGIDTLTFIEPENYMHL